MLALVLLAAGASRRLGRPKALAPIGSRAAIDHLLAAGAALGDPRPLVITGAHHAALAAHLAGRELEVLANPNWAEGRTGSLSLAASARAGDDLCIAPVDHPLVSGETFALLGRSWRERGHPATGWLAPRLGGRYGHPVLIGRDLASRLGSMDPDQPLRDLRPSAIPLWAVPVRDRGVLLGLDTPSDLEALRGIHDRTSDDSGRGPIEP